MNVYLKYLSNLYVSYIVLSIVLFKNFNLNQLNSGTSQKFNVIIKGLSKMCVDKIRLGSNEISLIILKIFH